jgi:predicted kinase
MAEMKQPGGRLMIVCGLPGSGKTTYARQIEARFSAIRFCPDEWMSALSVAIWDERMRARIEALQWQFAQQLLALGGAVIIEWGTWARSERDALRLRARELGALVELHYVTGSVDVLFERLQQRGTENPAIQRDELLRWARSFQVPTDEEKALFDRFVMLEATALH